jgi:Mce-associated membrane protein
VTTTPNAVAPLPDRGRRLDVPRLLVLALGAALLVLAAVLGWQAHSLRQDSALANRALLDEPASQGVSTLVSRSLAQVLSYDWTQPDAARAAADQLLSGQARKEYDTLFASLQERAPDQKLTLTAEVQVVGVQRLTSSAATLLVFIDQSSTRAKDKESSVSAAQLLVDVRREGQSWQITGLQIL